MTNQTPKSRLEGRVASILNARELVVNIGADAGVTQGQGFAVLAATPMEIRDPDSDEVLDTIDREKVRVEAHDVRPRIAICRTYRMRGGALGALGFPSSELLQAMSRPVAETLRVEDSSIPPPLSEEESYVKINDRVVAVDKD